MAARVTAQNCTGTRLSRLKMQGGTAAWVSTDEWQTDPDALTVTPSPKKKNVVLTATLAEFSDQATASITVKVSGTVGKNAVCGSLAEIAGDWSASARTPGGSTVKSPETPPATITIACGSG
jgi:hypothetical protein